MNVTTISRFLVILAIWTLAAILLFGVPLWVALEGRDNAARVEIQRQQAYSAWCKLNDRTDITYEEWNALRATNSLTK